jgi:hypothetical protein
MIFVFLKTHHALLVRIICDIIIENSLDASLLSGPRNHLVTGTRAKAVFMR